MCHLNEKMDDTFMVDSICRKFCINTAAVVTIVLYSTLVVRCSRQLIDPADWVYVILVQDPYAVISPEAVAYSSYCNTVEWFWWD